MIFKMIHFWYCIRNHGLIDGFKYWKLTIRATLNPIYVGKWVKSIRQSANNEDVMKQHLRADNLREIADEIEKLNKLYHDT